MVDAALPGPAGGPSGSASLTDSQPPVQHRAAIDPASETFGLPPTKQPFGTARVEEPAVDIVIPVFNEQVDLERNVRRLHEHLCRALPYPFRITIADNASTDESWSIARSLAGELPGVHAVHLDQKGRGRALREVWSRSDAAVLAYMDVDLSTDLSAVLPLVAPLLSGHSDVAIGTRLTPSSRVVRGSKRELISRSYNLVVRTTLGAGFTDAQCGFKAIRADAAAILLPLVKDPEWFFDTELLVLAERSGMRIHEVPVDWVDDPTSTVDILETARKDLAGIWRLARGLRRGDVALAALRTPAQAERTAGAPPGIIGQLSRFVVVGLLSTLVYAALFWMLRENLTALWANAVALLVTAIANTAANRSFTFGVRGRRGRVRHQAQGLFVFLLGLFVTTGSLALLTAVVPDAARAVELLVLTGANVVATMLRFLLFRSWVFRTRPHRYSGDGPPAHAADHSSEPTRTDHPSIDLAVEAAR